VPENLFLAARRGAISCSEDKTWVLHARSFAAGALALGACPRPGRLINRPVEIINHLARQRGGLVSRAGAKSRAASSAGAAAGVVNASAAPAC
jgi:hypothetical protein